MDSGSDESDDGGLSRGSGPAGKDLVMIIYVHGQVSASMYQSFRSLTSITIPRYSSRFKGTDVTFEEFPDRIKHLVQATLPKVKVRSEVFPVYETKGDLTHAVERFVEWLTELTVHAEVDHAQAGGSGKAKIVLCGHSMGGLLIADSVLRMQAHKQHPDDLLWPWVIAVIAFDTPYLGLHPHVFKNGITKYTGHIETARTVLSAVFGTSEASPSDAATTPTNKTDGPPVASTSFFSLPNRQSLLKASAVALGGAAAVGTAYWRKDDIHMGWKWVSDHAVFVGNLWDDSGMRNRLEGLAGMVRKGQMDGIVYRNFYTHLPSFPPQHLTRRTFCLLPSTNHPLWPFWKPVTFDTKTTEDEVASHLGMFNPRSNMSFFELGLDVVNAVVEAMGTVEQGESSEGDVEMD